MVAKKRKNHRVKACKGSADEPCSVLVFEREHRFVTCAMEASPSSTSPLPNPSGHAEGRGPRFRNRTRSQRSTVSRTVTTILCAVVCLAMVIITVQWGGRQWSAMLFRKAAAQGVVIQTKVVQVSHVQLGKVFEARTRVSYDVDGTSYVSNDIAREILYYFRKNQAERIASRYHEGHSVNIYYNPLIPSEAIVEKRMLVEHAPTMLLVPPFLLLLLGRVAGPLMASARSKRDPSRTGVSMDRTQAPGGGEQLRVRMPSEDAVRHGRRVAVTAVSIVMLLCGIITWFFPGSISFPTVCLLTLACAASGIAAGFRRAVVQMRSGRYLLLDPQAKTFIVKGRGRDERDANVELHAHEIEAIVIEDVWRRPWRWDQRFNRKSNELLQDNPAVTVRLRTGGVIPIAIWHHPTNAPEFGKWLCSALGAVDRGEMPGERREAVDEEKD